MFYFLFIISKFTGALALIMVPPNIRAQKLIAFVPSVLILLLLFKNIESNSLQYGIKLLRVTLLPVSSSQTHTAQGL